MRGAIQRILTIAGRGCAAALALALVLHGSTKRPPVRRTAAPASPAVRVAPSVAPVPGIPDPPEAPPGMCAATNWWRRGAFSDWRRVDFPAGWSFPWGTNRLHSAALLACGEIRPPGDPVPVASVGGPLGLAPLESVLWYGPTPSNTYAFAWRNALAGRDCARPVDARIELFRNGDAVVSANGVARRIPRALPFAHDGYGQDADWVRANFTNAEEILSVGYAGWVDAQVGVGVRNGLYRLTATLAADPPECLLLTVGGQSVAVTNAGAYAFLLGKGVRYGLDVRPRELAGLVSFSADDGCGGAAARAARGGLPPSGGRWTEDAGGIEIVVPNPMVPLVPPDTYVLWRPSLAVSPRNWAPSEADDGETFAALVDDVPFYATPSYAWRTGDPSAVSVGAPHGRTTGMRCHFPEARSEFPELTLEVSLPGCRLTSRFVPDARPSADEAILSVSLPDVLLANDDDDDGDGEPDSWAAAPPGDDDVARGRIVLRSPVPTNGTVVVEGIRGPGGRPDLFADAACTDPIAEGAEFPVGGVRGVSIPFYLSPPGPSRSYPGLTVRARWRPSAGCDLVASAETTVVRPTVEPICNATTNVMEGGRTRTLAVNPCGVGVGREAHFRVRLAPESFPDGRIVWMAEGGIEFVGGSTGRSVTVRGVVPGRAKLKVAIRDDERGMPEFSLCVTACTNIPIHAVIVADDGGPAQGVSTIRRMVEAASDVFEQVGMSFRLASVCTTNIPKAFRIVRSEETEERWNHRRLTDLLSNTGGIECYFVEAVVDTENNPKPINGLTSRKGIVLTRSARLRTLAHEIGHLCGARDIYDEDEDGVLTMAGEFVRWDYTPDDWNGGCYGRGEAGARYYPSGTTMVEIISRLLMNGFSGEDDRRLDMTLGPVYGIGYTPDDKLEKRDVDVGFEGPAGGGFMFRLPICE